MEKKDKRKTNPINVMVILTVIILVFMWMFGMFDSQPEKGTISETREQKVQHQFSSWDGSHIKVEAKIKSVMNNADSYEHVETKYWDEGNRIIVKTKFRGDNAFGAKVLSNVRAVIDNNENIIEFAQE